LKWIGSNCPYAARQALDDQDAAQGSYAKEELKDLVEIDLKTFHKVFAPWLLMGRVVSRCSQQAP
jgi:hypothetical protein